jgi:hypothetical protein
VTSDNHFARKRSEHHDVAAQDMVSCGRLERGRNNSAFLSLSETILTHVTQRIITADPSWFTVPMGTGKLATQMLKNHDLKSDLGVCVQLLTHFPYPSYWLSNLAYVFWVRARYSVAIMASFGP